MNPFESFQDEYLAEANIIDVIEFSKNITGLLLQAGPEAPALINYPYRLACQHKREGRILFTVNLEVSAFGTCCLGVESDDWHLNLGPANRHTDLPAFRAVAAGIARNVLGNMGLFNLQNN